MLKLKLSVVCVCVCVCVLCVCGLVYAVDRLHDFSGETVQSVYANAIKQPGNPCLVRVKA